MKNKHQRVFHNQTSGLEEQTPEVFVIIRPVETSGLEEQTPESFVIIRPVETSVLEEQTAEGFVIIRRLDLKNKHLRVLS